MTSSQDRMWLIERVLLGEAPLDTELTSSEKARLCELQADNKDILDKYPPALFAEEIKRRTRAKNVRAEHKVSRFSWIWTLGPSLAAACSLFLAFNLLEPPTKPVIEQETTRLKGVALLLHKKTPSGIKSLISGDSVREGDRIQVGYRIDAERYGVVVSVDGRGITTVHVPTDGEYAQHMPPGTSRLPFSYELDNAPEFERFFIVLSPQQFELRTVTKAAKFLIQKNEAKNKALALPDEFEQFAITLLKEDG